MRLLVLPVSTWSSPRFTAQRSIDMCHYPAAVLVLGSILAAFASAQVPQSPNGAVGVYFPTKPGTRRVYSYAEEEVVDVVTKVERNGNSFVVTTETFAAGKKLLSERWSVSEGNLSRVEFNGKTEDPPNYVVKDADHGLATWRIEHPGHADGFRVGRTLHGPEEVEVPAGKFHAVRIESEYVNRHTTRRSTAWYAEGVGLIKEVLHCDNDATITSKMLKSVTDVPAIQKGGKGAGSRCFGRRKRLSCRLRADRR